MFYGAAFCLTRYSPLESFFIFFIFDGLVGMIIIILVCVKVVLWILQLS